MIMGNTLTNALTESAMGTNCTYQRDLRDMFQQYRKAVRQTLELFVYR